MKKLTSERAIAQQLLVEHWEKPMRIPDAFSQSGNIVTLTEIDGKEYSLILYHCNYGKKKGFADGLWLIADLNVRGLKECQLGVRLA